MRNIKGIYFFISPPYWYDKKYEFKSKETQNSLSQKLRKARLESRSLIMHHKNIKYSIFKDQEQK